MYFHLVLSLELPHQMNLTDGVNDYDIHVCTVFVKFLIFYLKLSI